MANKYPDNVASEAMVEATQNMFRKPLVVKWIDEETGAHVSMSEFYITVEKHYPGSGRHGCVIPIALLDDVVSIASRHAKRLKENE